MVSVPQEIMTGFTDLLRVRGFQQEQLEYYKKWLRYFYDFSAKYLHEQDQAIKVRSFLEKLKSKGQSSAQCQQAAHAVTLCFEVLAHNAARRGEDDEVINLEVAPPEPSQSRMVSVELPPRAQRDGRFRPSQYSVAGYEEKSASPEWDEVMVKLAAEIKVRHYSRKTLQTYAKWSRQFQRFLKNKPPTELTTDDVKEYLTYLAVKCNVAASIQHIDRRLKTEG